MTPETYIKLRDHFLIQIASLQAAISEARKEADLCSPPEKRRKATQQDLVVGAIIWHWREPENGGWYWNEVVEVLPSRSHFDCYVADDGSTYHLLNAWVEDQPATYTTIDNQVHHPHHGVASFGSSLSATNAARQLNEGELEPEKLIWRQ